MHEQPDQIAMTPEAVEVRARMAHSWVMSQAAIEGVLPWSVRQHFDADVPALLADVERLRRDLDATGNILAITAKERDALAAASRAPGSTLRAQAPVAEQVARLFHETYERLAPLYGYRTREASAKPWAEVPESNRALMVATCAEVLAALAAPATEPPPLGEPVCNKPDWPLFEALRPVDLWLGPPRRDTVRLADLDLQQDG